jgi:hypothetical protein
MYFFILLLCSIRDNKNVRIRIRDTQLKILGSEINIPDPQHWFLGYRALSVLSLRVRFLIWLYWHNFIIPVIMNEYLNK